ncbi:MAG: recombinase family protein [Myxococcota bacterium]|nr:recombinase family protein [Myxococcota bacterium]
MIEADEGISGSKAPSKRPGLSSALARLDSGEAEGLLVLKLDRLSRSTRDVLNLVDATREGIGHSSWLLAQRPGMGIILRPRDGRGVGAIQSKPGG